MDLSDRAPAHIYHSDKIKAWTVDCFYEIQLIFHEGGHSDSVWTPGDAQTDLLLSYCLLQDLDFPCTSRTHTSRSYVRPTPNLENKTNVYPAITSTCNYRVHQMGHGGTETISRQKHTVAPQCHPQEPENKSQETILQGQTVITTFLYWDKWLQVFVLCGKLWISENLQYWLAGICSG